MDVGLVRALGSARLISAQSLRSDKLDAMAFGLAQFLRIVAGLLFVVATDAYRQTPRLRRAYGVLLLPVAIWFTLAPAALGSVAVFAPGFLLVAGSMASAGVAHLLLARQGRLLGAALVGAMLVGFAGLNAWLATLSGIPGAQPLMVTLVLFLLAALGMQLMTFEDMTFELRRTNRRLEAAQSDLRQAVITDALTGTRNRRFFDEVIGREMQRHRRYQTPLSIVFIDIDHFKMINDTLGHETGDQVLREVATFLLRHIREADYVFRWGGDEFLVLISCGEQEAIRRGGELQDAFAASPHAGRPAARRRAQHRLRRGPGGGDRHHAVRPGGRRADVRATRSEDGGNRFGQSDRTTSTEVLRPQQPPARFGRAEGRRDRRGVVAAS